MALWKRDECSLIRPGLNSSCRCNCLSLLLFTNVFIWQCYNFLRKMFFPLIAGLFLGSLEAISLAAEFGVTHVVVSFIAVINFLVKEVVLVLHQNPSP